MMASYHHHRFPMSPLPSVGDATSQCDASEAGAPHTAGVDASRTLPPEITALLKLIDAADSLVEGHLLVGVHHVTRRDFDRLPVAASYFAGDAYFWCKHLTTPMGRAVSFYTNEPPNEDTA